MWIKQHTKAPENRESGVALLTALGVLALVYLLGTAYVTFMTIETEDVQLTTRETMVRTTAERGIMTALSLAGKSMAQGEAPSDQTFSDWPVFYVGPDSNTPETRDDWRAHVEVTISDENARINLNSAPVRLLERILEVEPATARQIRQSLPRPGEAPNGDKRWLVHVDELVTRGLLTPEQFAEVPQEAVTVWPVPGTAQGAELLNINTAGPRATAAALAIDMGSARELEQQKPFASVAAATEAAGQAAASLAVPMASSESAEQTTVLSLASRCYRFRCTARLEKRSGAEQWRGVGEETIEAVAVFDSEGRATLMSWRAILPESIEDQTPSPAMDSGDTEPAADAETSGETETPAATEEAES